MIFGELLLKLAGDAKSWVDANKVAENAIRNTAKEALKAGQDLAKFNAQTINLLQGWKNELGDAARELSETLVPIKQGLVDQGKALDVNQKGITTLAVETVTANAAFESFAKGLNNVSSKLWVVTMGLQQAGRALTTAFTIPLVGIATIAVKTFADWEQGTKALQASADLSSQEAENFTKSLRELAMVMPLTVKELQEIAVTAAEAGVSTKNLERYTIAIGKLVTISKELNLKNAAEALVGISKAFGIAEENVERVGSTIRKMAKEAKGGMDDFVQGMLTAIPAATILNIGFEDMAAILAAIVPVSSSAARAGTDVSRMFDQMSRNLPELANQMEITQESLKEMISRDVVATLKSYIEGLQVSTDQIDKNNAVIKIFGTTGAKALRALVSQYDEFILRQNEAHDAFVEGTELTKDYEIMANTLTGTFKRFGNAVLEVAKVIGDDLNPIVSTFLEKAIAGLTILASSWQALSPWVKKIAIDLAGVLAILGPLFLALNVLISPIIGIFTALTKIIGIIVSFKAAGLGMAVTLGAIKTTLGAVIVSFGTFILYAGAIVLAITLIYKALDELFGITDKLKEALGITAFQQKFEDAKDKVKASLDELTRSFKEKGVDQLRESFAAMSIIATEWSDKIMEKFLMGFRDADFGILDDAMRIVDSYYKVLEKQGKMTVESIYYSSLEARRAIAQAIFEVKELGEISVETRKKLEGLVGVARMESIAKEIVAALKVEDIEETINKINDEIQDRRKALKKETEVIDKAIEERSKIYDDQIDTEEKAIKLLEKRKRDIEKKYKSELRAYEDIVDTAEKEKDIARDRLEAIKESNDLFIDGLKEQKDAIQENVDDAREALDDLKDLRKDEVDIAEGMLDYAKMNLESARNQLKKEQALGHDEWDVEWRAAKARTSAAEDQVDLAYGNYIRTKQLYKKEEDILEEELDLQEDQLKDVNKQIKTAERNAKAQEKIYEEQLDLAEDALKDAKRVLSDFRDVYQEQKDLLQDEIDERRFLVSDLKDSRDEILSTLKKERDAVNEKYQGEINILEDRLDVAKDALDNTKRILAIEEGINAQRLKLEQDRLAAAEAMGAGEFAGIAAGNEPLACFLEQIDKVNTNYDDMMCKMEDTTEEKAPKIGQKLLTGIFPPYGLYLTAQEFFSSEKWEEIKKWVKSTVEKIDWSLIGKTILGLIFPPYGLYLVLTEIFGIDWEKLKNDTIKLVSVVDWSSIGKTILGLLFPPYGLYLVLTEVFSIDWEKVKNDIDKFVSTVEWSLIGETILGLIFPPYGLFIILNKVFGIDWEKVKNDLVTFVSGINWGEVGTAILGALFAGPIAIGNLGIQIYNSIIQGLENLGPALQNAGSWIGKTIASGIDLAKDLFKDASNVVYRVAEGLNEKWEEISDWGKQIGGNIASGISNAWNNMKDATKNIVGGIASGLNDMWNQIKDWGKAVGEQISSGVSNTWWNMYDAVKNIIGGIISGINDKINDIWNWGKTIGENVALGVSNAWWKMYDSMKNILGGIASGINDKMNDLWNWGKSTGERVASGVYDAWWRMYDSAKNIMGGVQSGIWDKMNDIWNWGKSIGQQVAYGVYGAYDAIRNAARWIADVFKSFLGWWSPPEEGPMSEGDKWMPNMIKTLAQGIIANLPKIEGAVSQVGEAITGISANQPIVGTGIVTGAQGAIQGAAIPATAGGTQPGGTKQTIINLQPGVMIASKGEIRAFSRMLKQVQDIEGERSTRIEE